MHQPSSEIRFAKDADHAACRAAIAGGSKSFYAASWLLPRRIRQASFGLYAFCRLSDDAIDMESCARENLTTLRKRLLAAYRGAPFDHPADRAFADLVRRHRIPQEIPEALLEGLAWDCEGRRYATCEDLQAYAARVASTVGVMMTLLMGVRDSAALARACDLGVAMQFTNIARDVGEDARAGRLYLPLEWMAEASIDPEAFLTDPQPSEALSQVVARLLREADRLYARACGGIARLPLSCRPAIVAAATIYAEIGRVLSAAGHDSVSRRVRVSGVSKLRLLAGSCARSAFLTPARAEASLPAAQFLVDAVSWQRHDAVASRRPSLTAQALRVLDIFERLERAGQTSE